MASEMFIVEVDVSVTCIRGAVRSLNVTILIINNYETDVVWSLKAKDVLTTLPRIILKDTA